MPVEPNRVNRAWRACGLRLRDMLANGFIARYGMTRIVPPPGYIAIDPHVHSSFSKCSLSRIEDLLVRAGSIGLTAIGITDHNDFQSVARAAACAEDLKRRKLIPEDFLAIPGMEISCGDGHHIGGLFLNEPIPRKLGVAGTVQRIHEAGGLAVAVHPYLRSGIGDALFEAPFDAVEIESGSVLRQAAVERGRELLADDRLKNVAKFGSSDAHYVCAVGICYTLVKANDVTPDAIRSAILQGWSTPHMSEACLRLRKLLGRLSLLQ